MNPNTRRQLRDIQVRADRLINGSPTLGDIEEFDQSNEELKQYLLINLKEPELLERVKQIPKILDESDSELVARGFFSAILAMFASAFVTYFQERQQIENSKNYIREAQSAYATIEFFTRNLE
ncbi:MAG: hypothetical protein J0L67_09915 [Cytophagales bacterium]|nr:hypothetical protein [Cytophagales bacterium]